MGFCGMNFFSTAGSMVKPPQTVNGLAWEIRIFLKNSNPKQFRGENLGRELEDARGPVEDAADGVFGAEMPGNAPNSRW
jgi:hypothetical protein